MSTFVFKSSGIHLGFIVSAYLFSRDGEYLGWTESGFVWGADGQFRGEVKVINGNTYILRNIYAAPPVPKLPKPTPATPPLPSPPPNVASVQLPIGFKDAF